MCIPTVKKYQPLSVPATWKQFLVILTKLARRNTGTLSLNFVYSTRVLPHVHCQHITALVCTTRQHTASLNKERNAAELDMLFSWTCRD